MRLVLLGYYCTIVGESEEEGPEDEVPAEPTESGGTTGPACPKEVPEGGNTPKCPTLIVSPI